MNKDAELFNFLVGIRKRIINLINDIGDSVPGDYGCYYAKATEEHRKPIVQIIDDLYDTSSSYGLHRVDVYAHNDYNAAFNSKDILGKDYVMEDMHEHCLDYSKWNRLYDERKEKIKCPLCNKNKREHKIYKGYIITQNLSLCSMLTDVVSLLYEAKSHCIYKGKRSNIREILLQALLILNDIILPEPINEYIKKQQNN